MSSCPKLCSTACSGLMCITSRAHAATVCEGNFQIVDRAAISTPYCQDENLASSERKLSRQALSADVRRNPDCNGAACALALRWNETARSDYLSD